MRAIDTLVGCDAADRRFHAHEQGPPPHRKHILTQEHDRPTIQVAILTLAATYYSRPIDLPDCLASRRSSHGSMAGSRFFLRMPSHASALAGPKQSRSSPQHDAGQ